jgi:hypothetical protein
MAYGPNIPSMGNDIPHGPIPDILFPRTPPYPMPNPGNDNYGGMIEGVREQIMRTFREFSFNPKGCDRAYQKSYPCTLTLFLTRGVLGSLILRSSMGMILKLHMSMWDNS